MRATDGQFEQTLIADWVIPVSVWVFIIGLISAIVCVLISPAE